MIIGNLSNLLCLVFLVVGVRRELGGCCVVENQCVGRHVDNYITIFTARLAPRHYCWCSGGAASSSS